MALEERSITLLLGKAPETLEDAISVFLADCKARCLSPRTIATNVIILKNLCSYMAGKPVAQVTSQDLRRFFVEKATSTSPSTAQRYYNCIHGFFGFLLREEFISIDAMTSVQKPKAPAPMIQPLSQEQVEALVNACGGGFTGGRNRLILLLLIDTGLRASELCDLTLSDIDWENQTLIVRHGKGDKSRRVPFGSVVASAMRQYVARRAEVDRPQLLVTVYGDAVDRYRLRALILSLARKARVTHPHMGPHLLRHSMAVSYLRNGGDCFSLQKMLGHSTLVMTRRYSELADSDVSDKHKLYSPADRLKVINISVRKQLK